MLVHLRRSVLLAVIAFVLFGLVYPLVGTGLSQILFNHQAQGSLGADGSTLIGQNWSSPDFFHGRPDDAGPYAADPKADVDGGDNPLEANGVSGDSGATNLGPRSKTLLADTKELVAYWHQMGVNPTPDLVTTSGSGLDPDITPADATAEIPMVAQARGLAPATLRRLISSQNHSAQFGFLGSDYVDVLALNEALAKLK
jgi:potassium-transporting ATPase KdpC subunit